LHTAHTIDVDLPCVKCGYNLRTRAVDSICPECGQETWKSLPNDNFCFLTSHHAGQFRAAMAWIPLFVLLEALFVIQLQIAMWNWDAISRTARTYSLRIRWEGHTLFRFVLVVAGVIAWRSLRGEASRKARRTAIGLVLTSLVAALSQAATYLHYGRAWSLGRPTHMFPEDVLYVVAGLAWLATWWMVMVLLIRVQTRPRYARATLVVGAIGAFLFAFPEVSNAVSFALQDEFGDNFEWPDKLGNWVSATDAWTFKTSSAAWSLWLLAFWLQVRRLSGA